MSVLKARIPVVCNTLLLILVAMSLQKGGKKEAKKENKEEREEGKKERRDRRWESG